MISTQRRLEYASGFIQLGMLGQSGLTGYLPTVPRNNNTGDANYRLDMRFGREFHLNERLRLQIMGEGFNMFNRRNVTQYNTTAFNASTTQSGGASVGRYSYHGAGPEIATAISDGWALRLRAQWEFATKNAVEGNNIWVIANKQF